jgi:ribosomal protein S1
MLQVGENVQVVLKSAREEEGRTRVGLSLRRITADPLAQTLDDLLAGIPKGPHFNVTRRQFCEV